MIFLEKRHALLMLTLCSMMNPGLAAAADAGSVLFVKGTVTAERAPAVSLTRGDTVLDDDTVATGDASRAQLLMIDGAKIAIRPNSILRIDEYAYEESAATVVSQSDNKSVLSLVKGGFRTITGAVGKEDRSDYEVRTPVGVLGIRGTNFAVLLCGGDCNTAPNVAAGQPIEDGLYIAVTDGAIVFRAQGGEIVVSAGEFAFIPMATRVPEPLDEPPALLIDDELQLDADGSTNLSGFDSKLGTRRSPDTNKPGGQSTTPEDGSSGEAPRQPVIGTDADGSQIDITPGTTPQQRIGRLISFATGPFGGASTHSGTQFNEPAELQLDASNNVLGFSGPYPAQAAPLTATVDIGTSANVETGFDSITVLRWGRWSGGIATASVPGNTGDDSVDLSSQSLHWISGPDQAAPAMPITGVANYTLLGGTSPTDNLGNTGVLGSASFSADFTNLRVDSTLVIDIAGMNWMASGTGNLGSVAGLPPHLFFGNYGSVSIDGVAAGTGQFTGFFSEPGTTSDPAIPGGVGLTYSLQDGQGAITVSGAAAFGNP